MIITKRCLYLDNRYWVEITNTSTRKVRIMVPGEISGFVDLTKEEAIELADLIRETAYNIDEGD